jgi:MFS family permease
LLYIDFECFSQLLYAYYYQRVWLLVVDGSDLHYTSVGASAVVTIAVGLLSDRLRKRAIFIFIGCGLTAVGYILLLCQLHFSTGVKYMSVFIMAAGIFTMQPISVIWIMTNFSGHFKRSVGSAMVLGFGNIGSIVASNIYLSREAPRFQTGYEVSFAFIGLEVILCTGILLKLKKENRKRERGDRNGRLELPQEEVNNLGDDHPDFRFNY